MLSQVSATTTTHLWCQWRSQKFIFGGAKHKIKQLIISVYILIISILKVMYIQFNNQDPNVYYF